MKNKLIIITGCSGGGKSTIIDSLNNIGYSTIPEPGRIIVKDEIANNSNKLPWSDPMGFCDLLIKKSIILYKSTLGHHQTKNNIIFFDRSFLDAISYYHTLIADNTTKYDLLLEQFKFDNPVFMTPPWEDIFLTDEERKHSFEDAVSEYDRLKHFYPSQGYTVIDIPKAPTNERIKFILDYL